MFYRKNEKSPIGQAGVYFSDNIFKRPEIVERQRTHDDVEATGFKINVFYRHAKVFDLWICRLFLGYSQHFLGYVDTCNRNGALLYGINTMPTVAAS